MGDALGKEVRIDFERLVSFEEKHLAVMRVEVTVLNADAAVTVNCQILNRQDGEDVYGGSPPAPRRRAGSTPARPRRSRSASCNPRSTGRRTCARRCRTAATESGMTLAVAADHLIETANEYSARRMIDADIAKNVFRVQAKAGVPVRVTKLVAYHTSRGVPARELVDRCRRTLDRALTVGIDAVFIEQRAWLDAFWKRSDIRIAGMRLYHLLAVVKLHSFAQVKGIELPVFGNFPGLCKARLNRSLCIPAKQRLKHELTDSRFRRTGVDQGVHQRQLFADGQCNGASAPGLG